MYWHQSKNLVHRPRVWECVQGWGNSVAHSPEPRCVRARHVTAMQLSLATDHVTFGVSCFETFDKCCTRTCSFFNLLNRKVRDHGTYSCHILLRGKLKHLSCLNFSVRWSAYVHSCFSFVVDIYVHSHPIAFTLQLRDLSACFCLTTLILPQNSPRDCRTQPDICIQMLCLPILLNLSYLFVHVSYHI